MVRRIIVRSSGSLATANSCMRRTSVVTLAAASSPRFASITLGSSCGANVSRIASVTSCSAVGKYRYAVRRETSATAATSATLGTAPLVCTIWTAAASSAARVRRRCAGRPAGLG